MLLLYSRFHGILEGTVIWKIGDITMKKATNHKQFSVMINDRVADRLDQFSTTMGVSESAAVEIAINYFFDDPKLISGLMKGYREMVNLNREISHDFSCCEEDADVHLAQYRRRLRSFE